MKLVDSGVLIGLMRESDGYHAAAEKLLRNHPGAEVTDVVFFEALEFIRKRDGGKKASAVGRNILKYSRGLLETGELMTGRALELLDKYSHLSLCDATSIALLEQYKEREILSFDSDFDMVPGIRRIS